MYIATVIKLGLFIIIENIDKIINRSVGIKGTCF